MDTVAAMLDGTWIPHGAEFGGQAVPPPPTRLLIRGAGYVVELDDGTREEGRLVLVETDTPVSLDIVCERGVAPGRVLRAIVRRRGDLLQLSYFAEEGAARPGGFATAPGSLQVLVRYRREAEG